MDTTERQGEWEFGILEVTSKLRPGSNRDWKNREVSKQIEYISKQDKVKRALLKRRTLELKIFIFWVVWRLDVGCTIFSAQGLIGYYLLIHTMWHTILCTWDSVLTKIHKVLCGAHTLVWRTDNKQVNY